MAKVFIIGPAHPLRGGGLTTFNHRLAEEFMREGHQCEIYSFSLQYPSFLFPGKSQYSDGPAPKDLTIHTEINSVNPFNWMAVGKKIKKQKPDIILVRYWIPFMGPALGTILRQARKNHHTRIICLADNIIPHEKRIGDKTFTRYFVKSCDAFITMSEKVMNDLKQFSSKPAKLVSHPLYDNFGEAVSKTTARERLGLDANQPILLFFGFIRKYKGLDLLIDAMNDERIRRAGIKLLVAGEFYEEEKNLRAQITERQLEQHVILHTSFIADEEVRYYLCAADAVVQPYRSATQSGVTPLAYHFEKTMGIVRRRSRSHIGGLHA